MRDKVVEQVAEHVEIGRGARPRACRRSRGDGASCPARTAGVQTTRSPSRFDAALDDLAQQHAVGEDGHVPAVLLERGDRHDDRSVLRERGHRGPVHVLKSHVPRPFPPPARRDRGGPESSPFHTPDGRLATPASVRSRCSWLRSEGRAEPDETIRWRANHHGAHTAALGHVDDLLLRGAGHDREPVAARRKPHHDVKRLSPHGAIGSDTGKSLTGRLISRWTTQRSASAYARSTADSHSAWLEQRADRDAAPAVGPVRLQHEHLALVADEFEQVASPAIGEQACGDPRPGGSREYGGGRSGAPRDGSAPGRARGRSALPSSSSDRIRR